MVVGILLLCVILYYAYSWFIFGRYCYDKTLNGIVAVNTECFKPAYGVTLKFGKKNNVLFGGVSREHFQDDVTVEIIVFFSLHTPRSTR